MNLFWRKLTFSKIKKSVLIFFLITFSGVSLRAADKVEIGVNTTRKKLSSLSLQDDIKPLASKKVPDPFAWQNAKHYESVVKIFEGIADRELNFIIKKLGEAIEKEKNFFNRNYKYMISNLRDTVYDWLFDSVLTIKNFSNQYQQLSYSSSTESDDEEDGWRQGFRRGYEGAGEDVESNSSCSDREEYGMDYEDDYYLDNPNEFEQEHKDFQSWQISTLKNTLGIDVDSISEFTKKNIDINAIKIFLKDHCYERGRKYSWLLNQIIEGDLSTSEDFISLIFDTIQNEIIENIKREKGLNIINKNKGEMHTTPITLHAVMVAQKFKGSNGLNLKDIVIQHADKKSIPSEEFLLYLDQDTNRKIQENIGIPREALDNIFGGFWFYYDWEEFEIDDPCFIQKTYIQTLRNMKKGGTASEVKKRLLKRIQELFSFNQNDFLSPLREICEKYNEYNKKRDWLGALVEWSVYSTYRKVFANPAKRSGVQNYVTASPAVAVFQTFNREAYLLSRLNDAYIRAHAEYTKVYPHADTKKIVFGSSLRRAELDIQNALGQLRGVGNFLEPFRKRGTENVFVPQFYFIVSANPNQASADEGQQFFHVPLRFKNLPKRPLTRASEDVVFADVNNDIYFDSVRKDVVAGNILQGKKKEEAEREINNLINGGTLACNQKLVHSERGIMHVFRQPSNVKKICKDFANLLKNSCGNGLYTVHGAVMLSYSTNTVCPCCTPTLIALQNSHEPAGFLNLLVQELNDFQGEVTFNTTGYNLKTGVTDWAQFRLNTFITAKINFDSEAHDLAEDGQHCHGQVKKAPSTHNPHAKLFFPNDEIDISKPLLLDSKNPDPYQRFFYEFVGKNMHILSLKNPYIDNKTLKFPGVVFSSGSEVWGVGVMQ